MKAVTFQIKGAYYSVNEREDQLKQLFLQAQKNDEKAYQAWLIGVSELLRVYITKLMSPKMRSPERVEDLVQDILITIHRKRDLYSPELPLLPWIYAIAKYRFIDLIRSESRKPEFVEWMEELDTRFYDPSQDTGSDEKVEGLLGNLTEKQKAILTMAKVDEVPLKEIATHFKMSLSAVKVTLHRVLKNLRI